MKNITHKTFTVLLILINLSLNAQLRVKSDGHVILGDVSRTPTSLLELSGMNESIEISNGDEDEAGIIFYDRGYETSQFCKMLFNCASNDLTWYTNVGGYDMRLTPSGNLYIAGTLYQYSDSSVKTDIKLIGNEFYNIYNLSTYSYKLKTDEEGLLSDNNEIIIDEKTEHVKHYGFIAQELKEVFPELVVEGSNGKLNVDYISVIPLLLEALKEQRRDLEELKIKVADLDSSTKKSLSTNSNNDVSDIEQVANSLLQNAPNPFSDMTTIKYFVADAYSGSINIYNLQGNQIKSFDIQTFGQGSLIIPGSTLEPGIYVYNLILDGNLIDTKQMILTN